MRRIILGLITIIGAGAIISSGVTGAFFSDTETSVGNTFAAGAIDLLVDNESYYNGNVCTDTDLSEEGENWQWQGNAPFPIAGTACNTSWNLDDLSNGHLFFDFTDLKPDDEGEDTISLHVDSNPAWACMDITLTSNDDISSNEPELATGDEEDVDADTWDGELAENIEMAWWADDGNNVLEADEEILSGNGTVGGGVETLSSLATSTDGGFQVALADSDENAWGTPGPIPGNTTVYVAKAWCFGDLTLTPLAAGTGVSPDIASGVSCSGAGLGNETQTDGATLDISFSAIQARHNASFQCEECEFDEAIDLLIDGRFETPEVTNGAQWDIFPSVAGGWNVSWRADVPATFGPQNRPVIANLEFHEGVLGAAFEGDQYVELDSDWGGPSSAATGEPASVTIYREFATIPGANYSLKYHFAPRPNTPAADNNLEVRVEGVISDTTGPTVGGGGPIAWSERTVNFVATTSSTELRFTDIGTANSLGTFLDNVRLYQTSCPGTNGPAGPIIVDEVSAPQPVALLTDGFGIGAGNVNDIPVWQEEGADSDDTTRANAATSDQNSASPEGGKFAFIGQDEWMCMPVVTTGHNSLNLAYYWRGDPEAEPADSGFVEYASSGSCGSATWTTAATHILDADPEGGENWSSLQSLGLPNGITLIRFRSDTSGATENFRVDGINLTGIPN